MSRGILLPALILALSPTKVSAAGTQAQIEAKVQALTTSNKFPSKPLVLAIVKVESNNKPSAINGNAVGLMQVVAKSPKDKAALLNPDYNLRRGIDLLRSYYASLGNNAEAAVEAYNVGLTAYLENRCPERAKKYWDKIQRILEKETKGNE